MKNKQAIFDYSEEAINRLKSIIKLLPK